MTTDMHWDEAGRVTATDEHGTVKSPWDGCNAPDNDDPDARADILAVGRIYTDVERGVVFEGWHMNGRGRAVSAATVDPDTWAITHVSGWSLDELCEIAAAYPPGAFVPGRGEPL